MKLIELEFYSNIFSKNGNAFEECKYNPSYYSSLPLNKKCNRNIKSLKTSKVSKLFIEIFKRKESQSKFNVQFPEIACNIISHVLYMNDEHSQYLFKSLSTNHPYYRESLCILLYVKKYLSLEYEYCMINSKEYINQNNILIAADIPIIKAFGYIGVQIDEILAKYFNKSWYNYLNKTWYNYLNKNLSLILQENNNNIINENTICKLSLPMDFSVLCNPLQFCHLYELLKQFFDFCCKANFHFKEILLFCYHIVRIKDNYLYLLNKYWIRKFRQYSFIELNEILINEKITVLNEKQCRDDFQFMKHTYPRIAPKFINFNNFDNKIIIFAKRIGFNINFDQLYSSRDFVKELIDKTFEYLIQKYDYKIIQQPQIESYENFFPWNSNHQ